MLPTPNPEVIFKSVSEGAVLLHTRQEVYFGLNQVGAKIWELLPPRCRTWEELLGALRADYPDVEESVLRQDVTELLQDLESHDLVSRATGDDAAAAQAHHA